MNEPVTVLNVINSVFTSALLQLDTDEEKLQALLDENKKFLLEITKEKEKNENLH